MPQEVTTQEPEPACLCAWCDKIIKGGNWNRISHGMCGICLLIFVSEQFFKN